MWIPGSSQTKAASVPGSVEGELAQTAPPHVAVSGMGSHGDVCQPPGLSEKHLFSTHLSLYPAVPRKRVWEAHLIPSQSPNSTDAEGSQDPALHVPKAPGHAVDPGPRAWRISQSDDQFIGPVMSASPRLCLTLSPVQKMNPHPAQSSLTLL